MDQLGFSTLMEWRAAADRAQAAKAGSRPCAGSFLARARRTAAIQAWSTLLRRAALRRASVTGF
jgi:hypothetical protein